MCREQQFYDYWVCSLQTDLYRLSTVAKSSLSLESQPIVFQHCIFFSIRSIFIKTDMLLSDIFVYQHTVM